MIQKQFFISFLAVVLFYSCGPKLVEISPVDSPKVLNIGVDSLNLEITGEIISVGDGIDVYGHVWTTDGSIPSYENNLGRSEMSSLKEPGFYRTSLGNPIPDKQYLIRAYLKDVHGVVYYDLNNTIVYDHTVPSGVSISIDSILPPKYIESSNNYTVRLQGTLNNLDMREILDIGIEVSLNQDFTIIDKITVLNKVQNGSFESELSGISPGSIYHIRPFFIDDIGNTKYGSKAIIELEDIWVKVETTGEGPFPTINGVAIDGLHIGFFLSVGTFWSFDPKAAEWCLLVDDLTERRGFPESWSKMGAYTTKFSNGVGAIIFLTGFKGHGNSSEYERTVRDLNVIDKTETCSSFGGQVFDLGIPPRIYSLVIDYFNSSSEGLIVGGMDPMGNIFKDVYIHSFRSPAIQVNDFPSNRLGLIGFMINNIAYVGGGATLIGDPSNFNINCQLDFWSFDRETNQWNPIPSLPFNSEHSSNYQCAIYGGGGAAAFVVNDIGYIVLINRSNDSLPSRFVAYDPSKDKWSEKKALPFKNRILGEFVIAGAAYLIVAKDGENSVEVWRYYP